jgi:hypothetical protein
MAQSTGGRGSISDLTFLALGLMVFVFGLVLSFLLVVYSRTQLPQTIGIPMYEQHSSKSSQTVRESTNTRLDNNRVHPENSESEGMVD